MPMKYSLRSLMRVALSFRDLLWLAVVLVVVWWWRTDHWVSAYTHNLMMIQRDSEIRQLKEKLHDPQTPAPNLPKD